VKSTARSRSRAVLSMAAAGLVVVGLGELVPGIPSRFGLQTAEAASADNWSDDGKDSRRPIKWDVAIDCRTWRFNGGISFEAFGRGDTFIANGKIFRSGTLPPGAQANDPNEPGSIGNWVERGTMAATLAEILAGTRPAFFATWFHLLDDGSAIVADGAHPESGPMAVVGGRGKFSGATGELSDVIIGTNSTGCPNLKVTIRLQTHAPK
jgi:hypothetical protein